MISVKTYQFKPGFTASLYTVRQLLIKTLCTFMAGFGTILISIKI